MSDAPHNNRVNAPVRPVTPLAVAGVAVDEEYTKRRNDALPPEQFHMFVERTSEARMTGRHRTWTGNDKNGRCHHGKVRLSENPLYLRLEWKTGPTARPRFVGNFEIKLRKLLANEYLREEGDGVVRLRFYHGHDDVIYIQKRLEYPGIPVGHLGRSVI